MIEVRYFQKERHHKADRSIEIIGDVKIHALLNEGTQMYEVGITPSRLKELQDMMGYDLSLVAKPNGQPHPFWDSAQGRVRLSRQVPNLFNPSIPLHELQLGILRKSPFVAESEAEIKDGSNPTAIFYIYDGAQEVKAGASVFARQADIYARLNKLRADEREDVAWMVKGYEVHNQPKEYVDGLIYDAISSNIAEVETVLAIDKTERSMYALLERASAYGIITRSGPRFLYQSIVLGDDAKAAVGHLLSPTQKQLVAEIKAQIEAAQITK